MTNIPNQNIKDTYKERKALVGTNFLTIYVENTLPIFITKDSVITDTNTMIRKTSGAACNTEILDYAKKDISFKLSGKLSRGGFSNIMLASGKDDKKTYFNLETNLPLNEITIKDPTTVNEYATFDFTNKCFTYIKSNAGNAKLPVTFMWDNIELGTGYVCFSTSSTSLVDNTNITFNTTINQDRFISIATVQSPLTYNKVNLYYDTKWKDIILTPNLEFYSLVKNGNYDVRAYRLGNRNVLTSKMISLLGIEEASRVQLPEAKANTGMTTYLTSIPGFHSESFIDTSRFEESVGTFNLLHSDRSLMTILNLGTGSKLFTGNTLLPVYLLHQMSFRDYGFESVGLQDVSSTNLYVAFRF